MLQITEWLRTAFGQIRGFLAGMPVAQRATFVGAVIVFVAGFGGFVWWASQPVFDSVFTNLDEADAAAIVEHLQKEKIPYRLEHGGRAVLVPAERVHELRLLLARAGLPQGSGVGFEIFDEQKLGMTDFMQRLNYTRALQGELARTISQIAGVASARVHLAVPERSLFTDRDRKPSASVALTLAPGRLLGGSQVAAIVHLVASSVQGLAPDDIAVVDNAGRVLAGPKQAIDGGGLGDHVLEYQRTLEHGLEERIESMIGRVVGPGKVNARVSVALGLTRVERTEERVDPDQSAVVSERSSREESAAPAAAGGAPGIANNLTNEPPAAAPAGPRTERRDESVTYEVSKVTSRTIGPIGQIERLSVAVLIDGTYEERDGAPAFVPRPAEEIARFTELVKSAVGFSDSRGDRIELASVPFQTVPQETESWLTTAEGIAGGVGAYVPRLVGVGLLLAFFLMIARPALRDLAAGGRGTRVTGGADGGSRAIEVERLVQRLGDENRKLSTTDPERAAYLIRQWLQTRE